MADNSSKNLLKRNWNQNRTWSNPNILTNENTCFCLPFRVTSFSCNLIGQNIGIGPSLIPIPISFEKIFRPIISNEIMHWISVNYPKFDQIGSLIDIIYTQKIGHALPWMRRMGDILQFPLFLSFLKRRLFQYWTNLQCILILCVRVRNSSCTHLSFI